MIEQNIEIWKDIIDYEGLYMVSNLGRVKSLLFNKEKILRPRTYDKYGHLFVTLWKNKKPKALTIHSLVLESFVGPRPKEMEIRHLDGKANNNYLENLRYGTKKENEQDKVNHGTFLFGDKCPWAILDDEKIHEIDKLLKDGILTQKEIANKYNVHQTTVCDIKRRKRWKHIKRK